ncbi:LOB domain-containing protein 37-like [Canna indica]|uniref:LOB domain-containing protein 37-like n=1 Tax=Canna indica TaxID=4628 RepID=A0AAQ3Q8B6_9LILI|nr:LOB domain-containing protein 37-like [Canna indica]
MSCNGCRVLRKGCSDACVLRPCVQWIDRDDAQAHATVFVAKFFGRSTLLSFLSSAPIRHRPAVFRSLLYEACGRTINPVSGATGLLWSGRWHACHAAVETVLAGGTIEPLPELVDGATELKELYQKRGVSSSSSASPVLGKRSTGGLYVCLMPESSAGRREYKRRTTTPAATMSESSVTTMDESTAGEKEKPRLLNLFQ